MKKAPNVLEFCNFKFYAGPDNILINSLLLYKLKDNYVEWDSSMAGLLISGYYIGQVFTSLLFGSMSGRLSGKRVVLYLTSIITVTSVLTPAVTFTSPYVVLTTRIIIGIATVHNTSI